MFTGVFNKKVASNYTIDTVEKKLPLLYFAQKNLINSAIVIKQSDFFYKSKSTVRLVKFKDYSKIIVTYNFKPSIWSWLIGLCCFPLGFLIFIFTSNAKNDFEQTLHNIDW